jgi:hypothetical protein
LGLALKRTILFLNEQMEERGATIKTEKRAMRLPLRQLYGAPYLSQAKAGRLVFVYPRFTALEKKLKQTPKRYPSEFKHLKGVFVGRGGGGGGGEFF